MSYPDSRSDDEWRAVLNKGTFERDHRIFFLEGMGDVGMVWSATTRS